MLGTDVVWDSLTEKPRKQKQVAKRKQSFYVKDFVDHQSARERAKRNRIPPQQEFLQMGDPVGQHKWRKHDGVSYETRIVRRGKQPSMRYAKETPWPTYSQWGKPQWVDINSGIQYRMADGKDWAQMVHQGVVSKPNWHPDNVPKNNKKTEQEFSSGNQLLYLRFPRGGRTIDGMAFPNPREKVTLLYIKTGEVWQAKVEMTEGRDDRKAATGNVLVESLEKKGVANPEQIKRAYKKLPNKHKNKRLLSGLDN